MRQSTFETFPRSEVHFAEGSLFRVREENCPQVESPVLGADFLTEVDSETWTDIAPFLSSLSVIAF